MANLAAPENTLLVALPVDSVAVLDPTRGQTSSEISRPAT